MEHEEQYLKINKYDREFGNLNDGTAIKTDASTIENTGFRGETVTYIVQTFRRGSNGEFAKEAADKIGDFLSLKVLDGDVTFRVILPPRVTNRIAAQRESLTTRRRSAASKAAAKKRMDAGILPGFMRKKKGKKTHGDRVK